MYFCQASLPEVLLLSRRYFAIDAMAKSVPLPSMDQEKLNSLPPSRQSPVLRNISAKHHAVHVRTARVGVFPVIDRIHRSVPQRRCISRLDIKRNASVQRVCEDIVGVGAHHTIGARRRDPSGDPALLSVVLDQSL